MMSLEEVKEQLKDMNLSKVAKAAGLNRHVLYMLMKSDNPDPSYKTMKKLIEYLEKRK